MKKKIACENKTKNRTSDRFFQDTFFWHGAASLSFNSAASLTFDSAAPSLFEVSFNGQSGLSVKQDCT